jgi:hypothetical protein
MRRPTLPEFIFGEILVWLLVLCLIWYYHDWTGRLSLSIFCLKFSVVNVAVALFNMILFSFAMVTGKHPWSDRP